MNRTPIKRGGTAKPKTQRVLDAGWLAVVRAMPCAFCGHAAPSEPHHWPPKSRTGVPIDVLTLPVCRRCHDKCQRYEIPSSRQTIVMAETVASVLNGAGKALGAADRKTWASILRGDDPGARNR